MARRKAGALLPYTERITGDESPNKEIVMSIPSKIGNQPKITYSGASIKMRLPKEMRCHGGANEQGMIVIQYAQPACQRYVDCAWFVLIEKPRETDNGPVLWCQTRITGKGQVNIARKLREDGWFGGKTKK